MISYMILYHATISHRHDDTKHVQNERSTPTTRVLPPSPTPSPAQSRHTNWDTHKIKDPISQPRNHHHLPASKKRYPDQTRRFSHPSAAAKGRCCCDNPIISRLRAVFPRVNMVGFPTARVFTRMYTCVCVNICIIWYIYCVYISFRQKTHLYHLFVPTSRLLSQEKFIRT